MAKQKRTYLMEFKQEALRLLATSGKSVRQVEADLGITPGLLRKWKVRYQPDAETGDVKPSEQRELQAENRRLRRELAQVTAERELLKKVVKLFSVDADGKSMSIGEAMRVMGKEVLGWRGLKDLWRLYRS